MLGGASSLWYRATTELRRPTDMPATRRPNSIIWMENAATCKTHPTTNIEVPSMMEAFRPHLSKK